MSRLILTNLQGLVQIPVVVVESNKTSVTTAESNLIATIVPPVTDTRVANNVTEGNHGIDLTPTMFADPAITTALVLVKRKY